ncbi:helix-turn-helix domain-containing protein [Cupriavidus numazuensis]|uniref:Plasmid replication protein C N-terminal domain-containing protein n=1 Tax=Cupriavidus numazuensis TaxID=221992 RepID=A0ABM8TMW0_9BURK|nr:helix-turn-helix domain-containing protein [Cupriavidus numazuensis]CAG2155384.1 hypothetical protein LMG26411_04920 [Cupriavidus numazuensis]
MTFAQRSVAGEDDTRCEMNQPTALIEALTAPAPKRLKRKTIEAVERASRIGGLGRSARDALAALARTANNDDPHGRIFKHRETLCTETGMSSATWYRAQRELLDRGLITVDTQVRKRYGRFAGAYIYLTERATQLLGLTSVSESESQDGEGVDATPIKTATNESVFETQPSLKMRGPFTVDRLPYPFHKGQQDRLPHDLQRLRSLGIDKKLIFWLMRKAKEQGHFLSHVVEVAWQSLSEADSPKAYLLALLRARTDFTAIRNAKVTEAAAAQDLVRQREFVDRVMAERARQRFVDRKGNEFEVESDAKSVLVRRDGSATTLRLVGPSLAEFATRLDRGEFVPMATHSSAHDPAAPALGRRLTLAAAASLSNLRALVGIKGACPDSLSSGAVG